MKKRLSGLVLFAFILVGFTAQSWAFGSRHGHGGSGNTNSGSNSTGGTILNNPIDNNSGSGSGSGSNSGSGSGVNGNGNPVILNNHPNFPVAPVPEPMTVSLLGTGLAGFLLKRKNS